MKIRILSLFITISAMASAQTPADTIADQSLHEVTVKARRPGVTNLDGALNGHNINRAELFKAACCNLGESFSTNPSVDVSYNDAATGARQIKLLGLAHTCRCSQSSCRISAAPPHPTRWATCPDRG